PEAGTLRRESVPCQAKDGPRRCASDPARSLHRRPDLVDNMREAAATRLPEQVKLELQTDQVLGLFGRGNQQIRITGRDVQATLRENRVVLQRPVSDDQAD